MAHDIHASSSAHGGHGTSTGTHAKPNTKGIWRTLWILIAITAAEFIIAFSMESGPLRISIFLVMTLVKAFYIVSEFMHLKGEVKTLIWSIIVPTAFIVWLVVALMLEGNAIGKAGNQGEAKAGVGKEAKPAAEKPNR